MPFKKGQSGNPNGRPKGSVDKRTKEKQEDWDNLRKFVLEEGSERYMNAISKMKDSDFVKHYENILEYFKPKQSRQDVQSTVKHQFPGIKPMQWGNEQLPIHDN